METEMNTATRSHHHSGHRHHSSGSGRRHTEENNKKIRRKKIFINAKRIVFIILAVGAIGCVVYLLANPDAQFSFLEPGRAEDTQRIEELEREVERLSGELELYRSGQIPAAQQQAGGP